MFSRTVRRLTTVAALSALTTTLAAAPAAADTRVFLDREGDLKAGADIQRVRVVNEREVRVKVVHRNLRPSYRSGSSIAVFLDTDRTRGGAEFVFLGGTFEGADYALLPATGWRRASDQQVPLHGGSYSMKLDFTRDTALIRIDRRVLRNPGAVRVEVKTGAEIVRRGDQPATTGMDWLGKSRQFTPWVAHG